MLFGKEKISEELIFEQIDKITKESDKTRLLNLLININRKCVDSNFDLALISSLKTLARCRKFINGGFYQIISCVDLPFYPGDVLIFSHEENYQKGDILQYFTINGEKVNDEKVVYHYLIFDYANEDGNLVTKTTIPGDEKKYTVQSVYVLGRLLTKIEFGSQDWTKFMNSEGIAHEKIIDEINDSIKYLSENDFVTKEVSLQELNKRKLLLTGK